MHREQLNKVKTRAKQRECNPSVSKTPSQGYLNEINNNAQDLYGTQLGVMEDINPFEEMKRLLQEGMQETGHTTEEIKEAIRKEYRD